MYGVSEARCLPSVTTGKKSTTWGCCAHCGADPVPLEEHQTGKPGETLPLCPVCHSQQHLQYGGAGHRPIGTLIWMPDLSQQQLNLTVAWFYVALIEAAKMSEQERAAQSFLIGRVQSSVRRFEALSAPIATWLNRHPDATDPRYLAERLLLWSKGGDAQSAVNPLERLDGIRIMPNRMVFADYFDTIAPRWTERYGNPLAGISAEALESASA